MKTITLAFSTTNRVSSRFLRWAQRCEHSHVEVMFDGYAIGARTKGVQKYNDFSHLINKKYRKINVTEEQHDKFCKFLHDAIGQGYDWRAYLGFVVFKNTHKPNKWFCSELIQEAFNYAGITVLKNAPAYWTQPRDFWISPALDG